MPKYRLKTELKSLDDVMRAKTIVNRHPEPLLNTLKTEDPERYAKVIALQEALQRNEEVKAPPPAPEIEEPEEKRKPLHSRVLDLFRKTDTKEPKVDDKVSETEATPIEESEYTPRQIGKEPKVDDKVPETEATPIEESEYTPRQIRTEPFRDVQDLLDADPSDMYYSAIPETVAHPKDPDPMQRTGLADEYYELTKMSDTSDMKLRDDPANQIYLTPLGSILYGTARLFSATIERLAYGVSSLGLRSYLEAVEGIPKLDYDAKKMKWEPTTEDPSELHKKLWELTEYYESDQAGFVTPWAELGRAVRSEWAKDQGVVWGILNEFGERGVDLMGLILQMKFLGHITGGKIGGLVPTGVPKAAVSAPKSLPSKGVIRYAGYNPYSHQLAQTKAELGAVRNRMLTQGFHAFAATPGEPQERAEAALTRIGYNMTPYMVANMSRVIPGFAPVGYMAVLADLALNTFLTSPGYIQSYIDNDGFGEDFWTYAVVQGATDLVMSLKTTGDPRKAMAAMNKKQFRNMAKKVYGKDYVKVGKELEKARLDIDKIGSPKEAADLMSEYAILSTYWNGIFGDQPSRVDFNFDQLSPAQRARYTSAVRKLRAGAAIAMEEYSKKPVFVNIDRLEKAYDIGKEARGQLNQLERDMQARINWSKSGDDVGPEAKTNPILNKFIDDLENKSSSLYKHYKEKTSLTMRERVEKLAKKRAESLNKAEEETDSKKKAEYTKEYEANTKEIGDILVENKVIPAKSLEPPLSIEKLTAELKDIKAHESKLYKLMTERAEVSRQASETEDPADRAELMHKYNELNRQIRTTIEDRQPPKPEIEEPVEPPKPKPEEPVEPAKPKAEIKVEKPEPTTEVKPAPKIKPIKDMDLAIKQVLKDIDKVPEEQIDKRVASVKRIREKKPLREIVDEPKVTARIVGEEPIKKSAASKIVADRLERSLTKTLLDKPLKDLTIPELEKVMVEAEKLMIDPVTAKRKAGYTYLNRLFKHANIERQVRLTMGDKPPAPEAKPAARDKILKAAVTARIIDERTPISKEAEPILEQITKQSEETLKRDVASAPKTSEEQLHVIERTVNNLTSRSPEIQRYIGSSEEVLANTHRRVGDLLDENKAAINSFETRLTHDKGILEKSLAELNATEFAKLTNVTRMMMGDVEFMERRPDVRSIVTRLAYLQTVRESLARDTRSPIVKDRDTERSMEHTLGRYTPGSTPRDIPEKRQAVYKEFDDLYKSEIFTKEKLSVDDLSKIKSISNKLGKVVSMKPTAPITRAERELAETYLIEANRNAIDKLANKMAKDYNLPVSEARLSVLYGYLLGARRWDPKKGASINSWSLKRGKFQVQKDVNERLVLTDKEVRLPQNVADIDRSPDKDQLKLAERAHKTHEQVKANVEAQDYEIWNFGVKNRYINNGYLENPLELQKRLNLDMDLDVISKRVEDVNNLAREVYKETDVGVEYYKHEKTKLPNNRNEASDIVKDKNTTTQTKSGNKDVFTGVDVKEETVKGTGERIDKQVQTIKSRLYDKYYDKEMVDAVGKQIAHSLSDHFAVMQSEQFRVGLFADFINKYLRDHNMPVGDMRNVIPFAIEKTIIPEQLRGVWGEKRYDTLNMLYKGYKDKLAPLIKEIENFQKESFEKLLQAWPGLSDSEKANYISHLWMMSKKKALKTLGGGHYMNSPFTKKRIFDTFQEGMKAGYIPRTTDINDILLHATNVNARAIANKHLASSIKAMKFSGEKAWRFRSEISKLPNKEEYSDWKEVPHRNLQIPIFKTSGKEYRKISDTMRKILDELGLKVVLRKDMLDTEGQIKDDTIVLGRIFENKPLAHELGHVVPKKLGITQDFYDIHRVELMELNRERIDMAREAEGIKGVAYASKDSELFAELFATTMLDLERAARLAPDATVSLLSRLEKDEVLGSLTNMDFAREAGPIMRVVNRNLEHVSPLWHPIIARKLNRIYAEGWIDKIEAGGFPLLRVWRNLFGAAKTIMMQGSGFHAYNLSETASHNVRKVLLKAISPKNLYDYFMKGELPQYKKENLELVKDSIDNNLNFGTTGDYRVGHLERQLNWLRYHTRNVPGAREAVKSVAFLSQEYNKFLWQYLQPTYKLYTYQAQKEHLESIPVYKNNPALLKAGKRQIAQFANDAYGGQNWLQLGVSKPFQELLDLAVFAPDYNISIIRQFIAPSGVGAKAAMIDPEKYGIKPGTPEYKEIDKMSRNLRRKLGSIFMVKVARNLGIGLNLANAYFRTLDMEANPEFYDEEFGHNLLDYTMLGNSLGNKYRVFTGRDSKDRERYTLAGKQFRDPIRLLLEPISTVGGKLDPGIQTLSIIFTGKTAGRFRTSAHGEQDALKRAKSVAMEFTSYLLPISISTLLSEEQEFSTYGLVAPTRPVTEGASRWYITQAYEDIWARTSKGEEVDVDDHPLLEQAVRSAYRSHGNHAVNLIREAEKQAINRVRRALLETLPEEIEELREKLAEAETAMEIETIAHKIEYLSKLEGIANSDIDALDFAKALGKSQQPKYKPFK